MDALDAEMSIAEGEQALQALLKYVNERGLTSSRRTKRRKVSSSGCCLLGWRR